MDLNFRLLPINGEIVIVEDEPLLRELMREILCEVGAGCVAFPTADDALIHMHTRTPDVHLSSLTMAYQGRFKVLNWRSLPVADGPRHR